jgi:hypothetical protein
MRCPWVEHRMMLIVDQTITHRASARPTWSLREESSLR